MALYRLRVRYSMPTQARVQSDPVAFNSDADLNSVARVMVSSTFTDLQRHRAALIGRLNAEPILKAVAMENDSAKPVDVIESSLAMVRSSEAYIGVISRKYGQIPDCPKRNPDKLSLTELEFDQAIKLRRPILLFIMGERHRGREADFEGNATKRRKLVAFRERAKKMGPETKVHRVYAEFNSLTEFKDQVGRAVGELERFLATKSEVRPKRGKIAKIESELPPAPAFYAEPPYLGAHCFLGRKDQLETLDEWAMPENQNPVLLFEAIGGSGKSMLAWEWTSRRADTRRKDWAGRFWYSFYERGAVMSDFCQCALAYMTGESLAKVRKRPTVETQRRLMSQLQAKPWLLVLDGLERVLVSYHRIDAAQLADEEAGVSDQIAARDPCAAIRPEDDDLLRTLAAAAPSRLLVTSRLVPRVFLNPAGQAIPGVLRVPLPGLRPADAEALIRACGVRGASADIQAYLKAHCDCLRWSRECWPA